MLPRPLSLSAFGLERMVQRENIGALHVTLAGTPMWISEDAQHEVDRQVTEEFGRLGLLDAHGRPDGDLVDSLGVLCHPAEERYGWISGEGRVRGVLAAATGREAVLAIRDDEEIWMSQIKPEYLEQVLVAQLPDHPKAHGEVINVVHSELVAARSRTTSDGLRERPMNYEIHRLRQLAEARPLGGAELYVGHRDGRGGHRYTEHPLRIVDTPEGRWENVTTPRPDDVLITIAPAAPGDITARLRELRQHL